MSSTPVSTEVRVGNLEGRLSDLKAKVSELRNDYYDKPDKLGIRTRVIVMWHFSGALIGVICAVIGWIAKGVFGN